jgi:hypothetical protein
LELTKAAGRKIEKAVLYKSIVAQTALRQQEQSRGKGRLLPEQMREFVQAISWEMYSTSRDALDYNEGLPILKSIYPTASEVELSELADVAIVNQPELTKGEEGGFEFVHKSFSEYFVADKDSSFDRKGMLQSAGLRLRQANLEDVYQRCTQRIVIIVVYSSDYGRSARDVRTYAC